MLSDPAILKKIGQQPKRSAGYKQLARELGVRGDEGARLRGALAGSGLGIFVFAKDAIGHDSAVPAASPSG